MKTNHQVIVIHHHSSLIHLHFGKTHSHTRHHNKYKYTILPSFYLFKVACTNWKRVLLYLTYRDKNENSKLYQKLSKYNITDVESIPAKLVHESGLFENLGKVDDVQERLKILNEYTKFIMVRHPFDRLLSAYRNKLQGNTDSALYFQVRKMNDSQLV